LKVIDKFKMVVDFCDYFWVSNEVS
jgi:hypothetical protein